MTDAAIVTLLVFGVTMAGACLFAAAVCARAMFMRRDE
jgi:hypothetical protein